MHSQWYHMDSLANSEHREMYNITSLQSVVKIFCNPCVESHLLQITVGLCGKAEFCQDRKIVPFAHLEHAEPIDHHYGLWKKRTQNSRLREVEQKNHLWQKKERKKRKEQDLFTEPSFPYEKLYGGSARKVQLSLAHLAEAMATKKAVFQERRCSCSEFKCFAHQFW